MENNQVYILTRAYNDYYQHGDYFIAVFDKLPNHQQLADMGVPSNRIQHVIGGGGRVDYEEDWFILTKATFGEYYNEVSY